MFCNTTTQRQVINISEANALITSHLLRTVADIGAFVLCGTCPVGALRHCFMYFPVGLALNEQSCLIIERGAMKNTDQSAKNFA